MKKAWDNALANENLIGVSGAPELPIALSDHGVQMAKKTAKQFFKDLGISSSLPDIKRLKTMPGLNLGSVS